MTVGTLSGFAHVLGVWALPVAFVMLVAESALLVGVVLPGISVVVGVGLLSASGAVPWPVGLAVVVTAAVAGPSLGYWRARTSGTPDRGPGGQTRLLAAVTRLLAVVDSRPLVAVAVGQWFAVSRTLVPRRAGPRVSWRRFVGVNGPVVAAWAAVAFGLGHLVVTGSAAALRVLAAQQTLATVALVALAAVVVVSAARAVAGRRR